MADLLKTGTDWLHDQLAAHAASEIVYRRVITSLAITATVGGTRTEVVEEEGASYLTEQRDFIVLAVDLAGLFPPQRGDLITHGDRDYEVLPRGPNEDVWRWSDRHHKAVRVFARSRSST